MKYALLFIALFLGLANITRAQQSYTIGGVVTDQSGVTIPGVTVSLTGTKKAMATDNSGKFRFYNLDAGSYHLLVNMIGFESYRQEIKLKNKDINLKIKLSESNTTLNTVSITEKKKHVSTHQLNLFTEGFIGEDANAKQCKILNPETVNLKKGVENGFDVLIATAKDSIRVENDALGYILKYRLKKFLYYFDSTVSYYDGDAVFEKMKGTPEQELKWVANRKKAYLGSWRHFIKSAVNGRSRQEGYYVYEINDKQSFKNGAPLKPVDIDTLFVPVDATHKILNLKPQMQGKRMVYKPDLYIYYLPSGVWENELTWVKQFADTVLIDKTGRVTAGGNELFGRLIAVDGKRGNTRECAFTFWGRWSSQRVADLTPFSYDPGPTNDPKLEKKLLSVSPREYVDRYINH